MTEETSTQIIEWNVNDQAIAEVAEKCKEVDAYKDLDTAKLAKKALTKMRTALGDAHKETKAEALAFGKKCDTEKNRLLAKIREIEDPISAQLDEIKNAELAKEQGRLDAIEEAINRIEAHAADRYSLDLIQLEARQESLEAIEITDEVFQEQVERATITKQDAEMKLRLAVDAEHTAIKEKADADAQAEENRLLKEKLQKIEDEQAAINAETKRIADEEAAAQKVIDDARQAELDKQQAEIDAEKKRIRDANEAQAAADAKEKADAEAAEEAERVAEEAAKLAALQAPDLDKVLTFAALTKELIEAKPVMGSTKGADIMLDAIANLIEIEHDLLTRAEELK